MSEICNLEDIPLGGVPTADQIRAIIHRIDVKIYNIMHGEGTYGGMDIREGDHESSPTRLLTELRQQRKQYVEMLNDPLQMGDIGIVLSEWDNPDLPLGGLCDRNK